jgi:glycerol dehydrogenase-like iron-containing ADH family enzyme
VPPAEQVAQLLATGGGPSSVEEIGIGVDERDMAIADAHYLRDRFTVRKLARVLGI